MSSKRAPLFRPSLLAALIVWAVYEVVFYGLAALPGIPYADWFATADNGLRTAVIPLAVGGALLLAFALISRWDYLWRDPMRLKSTITMKIALAFWVLMRADGRSEVTAAIWTAVAFGLLHVPNIFLGLGILGASQVVLAAFSGLLLYAWRRQWGLIWVAMVAHGVWDISAFASGQAGQGWVAAISLPSSGVAVLFGIAVLVSIVRADRGVVPIPAGADNG